MEDGLVEKFRAFELFSDERLMRGFLRVGRLELQDGERIRRATGFVQPFDVAFAKMMAKTLGHLLGVFREVVFGIADCYEISVVLAGAEAEGGEGARGLLCRLGGEASGKLSGELGGPVCFDVRVYEFPSSELVRRYFLWRRRVNLERVLNRYFEYVLERTGIEAERIEDMLDTFGREEKIEILKQNNVVLEALPAWQRFGVGAYWQAGVDASEPSLVVETELPSAAASFKEYLARYV